MKIIIKKYWQGIKRFVEQTIYQSFYLVINQDVFGTKCAVLL